MQADEVLYLYPDRSRLPGPAIDVDEDPLPEVVLEVDHTTDVRRRKLEIYKESGFPEIWVLVPWEASVRAPGPDDSEERLGAHPVDPGAVRSAYRVAAMIRSGARAWRSGTSVSARPAVVHGQGGEDHQFSSAGGCGFLPSHG